MKAYLHVLAAIVLLSACTPARVITQPELSSPPALTSAPVDTRLLQAFGDTRYHRVNSDILSRPFHLFVRLPEEYAEDSHTDFPVIYLLDGGNTFPLLSALHHYLRLGDETRPAILVGIAYGAETYRGGNMRSTDFTAPSLERDFWGGAGDFQRSLEFELMPRLESEYRMNPLQRILFGQSLGGQFVLFNALTRPGLFYGHIASNPALHRNLPFFLEWQGDEEMPSNQSRLFVSSGSEDPDVFSVPAAQWVRHWTATEELPWKLETRILDGETHFSAAPQAFRQGLDWIYGRNSVND